MEELRKNLESILFSAGKAVEIEELARLVKVSVEVVKKELTEWSDTLIGTDSPLMLIEEGNSWKLTVREKYSHLVNKIVTETELSKTLMETLAVIAWRYPILQCDLIKIRTNKGYDHLKELEELGYITRQKHGRTKLIKLTQKFFDYFDLPREKLKEKFKDFNQIAETIENKEIEIEKMKDEQKKKAEGEGKELKQEEKKEPLDHIGEMKVYSLKEHHHRDRPKIILDEKHLGELIIIEEPKKKDEKKEDKKKKHHKEEKKVVKEEKSYKEVIKELQDKAKKELEEEKENMEKILRAKEWSKAKDGEAEERSENAIEGKEVIPAEVEDRIYERVQEVLRLKEKERKLKELNK